MRVIAGSRRGLKLISPENESVRPTTDRIKETIFNIISFELLNTDFLDLFSGTGSIGIEAISRGSNSAVFVDNSPESINIINKNLQKSNFLDKSTVINSDIISAISLLENQKKQFDFIFMDPPYNEGLTFLTLDKIKTSTILKNDGVIICEQSRNENLLSLDGFEIFKIKEYKTTKILFLHKIYGG